MTSLCYDGGRRWKLKLGDVIEVGQTRLRLVMGDFPLEEALRAAERWARTAPAGQAPGSVVVRRIPAAQRGRRGARR